MPHVHHTHRSGKLRASVLGANDGILSISGLMLGVAASHAAGSAMLVAGIAGLVAGSLSMGSGEYVSVGSQADSERADLELERSSLETDFAAERSELRDIYVRRGLDPELAEQVARQLMQHDALGAHARDEIGITDALAARPLQAALASSISFAAGGMVPLLVGYLVPPSATAIAIAFVSLLSLAALGAIAARVGGAPMLRGARRVLVWGAAALVISAVIGAQLGHGVG